MADKIDLHSLAQTWVHSHEEDTPGEMVFRPKSHVLPPSRGRKSFQLAPGGQLLSSGPAPDDRTTSSPGAWSLDQSDVLKFKLATGGTTELKILSVSPDKLIIKKE
jgi:hypothetical protein